jgi:predicted TIM-barrel fold metal-dependent hydrolase
MRRDLAAFDQLRDVYVGLKFLADYHRIALTDPRNVPAWEKADAGALPVLLHTWGGSGFDGPEQVRACAARYPNARILMGHSCHGAWQDAAALARDFANVYCELTAVLDDRGAVDLLVREAGSTKVVFGTDTPWFNHHNYIGALLGAEMTDEDRRNILYRNARRILSPHVPAAVLGPDGA